MPWQQIYLAPAFVACIMAIWTVFQPGLSPSQRVVVRGEEIISPTMKRKEKSLLILSLDDFFTSALKLGCRIGWLNTRPASSSQHDFWCQRGGCLLVGYFFGAPASGPWLGKRRCSFPLERFFCGVDLSDAGTAGFSAWVALCLFWVSGLGFSIVYPCVMSLAGHVFPHDQSRVVAWISKRWFGRVALPLLMSMISQHWDIQADSGFTPLSFLMLVAVFVVGRLQSKSPRT